MAREGGGGGGGVFGWTLLGILVGIAGTLAVQTLLASQHHQAQEDAVSAAPVVAAAPVVSAPVIAQPTVSAAPPAPKIAPESASRDDVEDDADAVGMTSRSHPAEPTSSAPGAVN